MVLVRLAVVCSLISAVSVDQARARCASPRAFAAPESGTIVPPDPRLWLFVPNGPSALDAAEAVNARTDKGRLLKTTVERVADNDAYAVYQIDVEGAKHDESFVLRSVHGESRYAVDGDWHGRAGEPFSVTAAELVEDRWSCSYTHAWQLYISFKMAPAYRISWEGGDTIVPAHPHLFFGRTALPQFMLELGHTSCLGSNMPENLLAHPLEVTVEPLYEVGSGPAWTGVLRAERLPPPPPPPATIEPPPRLERVTVPPVPVPVDQRLDKVSPEADPPWRMLGLLALAGLLLLARRRQQRFVG